MPPQAICCTCGHNWPRGLKGTHDCSHHLNIKIQKVMALLKDAPEQNIESIDTGITRELDIECIDIDMAVKHDTVLKLIKKELKFFKHDF